MEPQEPFSRIDQQCSITDGGIENRTQARATWKADNVVSPVFPANSVKCDCGRQRAISSMSVKPEAL